MRDLTTIEKRSGDFTVPVLQTRNLTIGYRSKGNVLELAKDINVEVRNGELVCLIGPNGCGKSTLMRTIAGLQKPLRGEASIAQVDVNQIKPHQYAKLLSLVLTDKVSVGAMTVMDIVSIGRYPYTNYFAKLQAEDHDMIDRSLESVHLAAYKHQFFNELSDGEKQRVLIAKALAQDTPLIMLDEPTAHLDLPNRVEIINLLKKLTKETNKAILLSTHELDLALQTADTIWLMDRGEGLRTGVPEDLVLSGVFEQVFKSKSFRFDKHSGSFKVLHQTKGKVSVAGNDVHDTWVRRALEREGYQIVDANESLIVVKYNLGNWQLKIRERIINCQNIAELLQFLRNEASASELVTTSAPEHQSDV